MTKFSDFSENVGNLPKLAESAKKRVKKPLSAFKTGLKGTLVFRFSKKPIFSRLNPLEVL